MPAAVMEGQPVALSLAEKAVCKVVYGGPRPHPLLLPVGLELWLYVQKMRYLHRKRCGRHRGGHWGRQAVTGWGWGHGCQLGGPGVAGGSWDKWRGWGLLAPDTLPSASPRYLPTSLSAC